MDIRAEIERAFNEWWDAPEPDDGSCLNISEYIMPLVKRAQAEALREAARVFAEGEWASAFMRGEVEDDVSAVQATDQWFNCRADRIERGEDR